MIGFFKYSAHLGRKFFISNIESDMNTNASYSVKGFVDLVDVNRIQGWFVCKELFPKRARISVILNGIEVASGIADISRPDLVSVGVGVDNFAFSLRYNVPLIQEDLAELRVYAFLSMNDSSNLKFEVAFWSEIRSKLIVQKTTNKTYPIKRLKTVYYITAPTASGKTTTAKRLSQEMNLPVFHADLVYNMLKDKYEINGPADRLLDPNLWSDPKNFGIKSWGNHRHVDDAKVELYEDLLRSADGDFIIEGFSLSLSSERAIINKVVGPHRVILLRIDLPFANWREMYIKKHNVNMSESCSPTYELLRSLFTDDNAFKVATFTHLDQITAHSVRNIPFPTSSGSLEFITQEEFVTLGRQHLENNPLDKDGNYVGYWKDLEDRWAYHKRVIDIIRQSGKSSSSALELGSMGISVVKNGHTIDYDKHISYYPNLQPHYIHDVRNMPWPILVKNYDWFIALRVFHHLAPVQRQCFDEARRIARNVILVVPKELPPGGGTPITPEDFVAWGNGVSPTIVEDVGRFGMLYAWLEL